MKYIVLLCTVILIVLNISACTNTAGTKSNKISSIPLTVNHPKELAKSQTLSTPAKQNGKGNVPVPSASQDKASANIANKAETRKQSSIQCSLFEYLSDPGNRESVKNRAISLNHGVQHNSCVYFVSEALRRVGMDMPLKICNTGKIKNDTMKDISLTYQLLKRGWKISYNLAQLQPGDICFTTADAGGKPTHSYVFMGWVKAGLTDFAYVCDNQSYYYGTTYHMRNIKKQLGDRDAFHYFMYKPLE